MPRSRKVPAAPRTKQTTSIAGAAKHADRLATPANEREPRRTTSIALSLSTLERAKVAALRKRISVAELIEAALLAYLVD